jgi:hypothetical protein
MIGALKMRPHRPLLRSRPRLGRRRRCRRRPRCGSCGAKGRRNKALRAKVSPRKSKAAPWPRRVARRPPRPSFATNHWTAADDEPVLPAADSRANARCLLAGAWVSTLKAHGALTFHNNTSIMYVCMLYVCMYVYPTTYRYLEVLAPRGAWLRQKSCQEISCTVVALLVLKKCVSSDAL